MEKLNVRFTDETKAEIKATSNRLDLNESELSRAAINIGLKHIADNAWLDAVDFSFMIKNNQTA